MDLYEDPWIRESARSAAPSHLGAWQDIQSDLLSAREQQIGGVALND